MATHNEDILVETYDAANQRHVAMADALDAMRAEEGPVMIPIHAEMVAKHVTGVIASLGETAVGYNGVIFSYEGGVVEMGGLYINPDFRGQGLTRHLKAKLFPAIKEIEDAKSVIAFANDNSLALNLGYGFKRAEREEIPAQGLVNCALCPKSETAHAAGQLCCDTVLILPVEELPDIQLPQRPTRTA
jgi:N-acetylglutamate synthase-like GNAT family acetyltransferase